MRFVMGLLAALMIVPAVCCADPWGCFYKAGLSCPAMKISLCPRADFEQIRTGCGGTSDYIWIEARDQANQPIPGIPWTDYWLNACNPAMNLWLCVEPLVADSLTGEDGRTTFTGAIKAGGCIPSGGVYIAVQGHVVLVAPYCVEPLCLNIVIKGPDLTGPGGHPDGVVDLADFTPFGTSYNTMPPGPYPPGKAFNDCCDFNDDGVCNLSDFSMFREHFQHMCF